MPAIAAPLRASVTARITRTVPIATWLPTSRLRSREPLSAPAPWPRSTSISVRRDAWSAGSSANISGATAHTARQNTNTR